MVDLIGQHRAHRLAAAKAVSDQHFTLVPSDATLPPLEQRLPDCPICYEEVVYDDGIYWCAVCHIQWGDLGSAGERVKYPGGDPYP